MLLYAILLAYKCRPKLRDQFLAGIVLVSKSTCFKTAEARGSSGRMGHLMEKCPIETLAVNELLFRRNNDMVFRHGIVRMILFLRLYRTEPRIIGNHSVNNRKRERLARLLRQSHNTLLLQLGIQFGTHLLKICLRDIEHVENLILGIDIILFLFLVGKLLILLPGNLLLCILVYDSEGREETGKDFSPFIT